MIAHILKDKHYTLINILKIQKVNAQRGVETTTEIKSLTLND